MYQLLCPQISGTPTRVHSRSVTAESMDVAPGSSRAQQHTHQSKDAFHTSLAFPRSHKTTGALDLTLTTTQSYMKNIVCFPEGGVFNSWALIALTTDPPRTHVELVCWGPSSAPCRLRGAVFKSLVLRQQHHTTLMAVGCMVIAQLPALLRGIYGPYSSSG